MPREGKCPLPSPMQATAFLCGRRGRNFRRLAILTYPQQWKVFGESHCCGRSVPLAPNGPIRLRASAGRPPTLLGRRLLPEGSSIDRSEGADRPLTPHLPDRSRSIAVPGEGRSSGNADTRQVQRAPRHAGPARHRLPVHIGQCEEPPVAQPVLRWVEPFVDASSPSANWASSVPAPSPDLRP